MMLSQSYSSIPLSKRLCPSHPYSNANGFLSFVRCFKRNPFEEVKKELLHVPNVPYESLARHKYNDQCKAASNEQIKIILEYNVSYIYHAMYAYFVRDNVALKGLAKFFKDSREDERQHAEKFMEYKHKQGGNVKLQSMLMRLSEFDHLQKGNAMELALSLEKLNNEKFPSSHSKNK